MTAPTFAVSGSSFTPEQLEARRATLGASEIPAVAGLHPHQTPLDVYLVKRGLVPPFEGNQFTEWGLRLERVLCDKYAEATGLYFGDQPGTVISSAEPWMSATPDRIVLGTDNERWGLEAKCKSARQAIKWGESGTDQIPHDVAAQCHWSMLVTGLARWDVVVLFGGNDYRSYTLRYDTDIADSLMAAGWDFWHNHVVPGVEPRLDGSRAAHDFLARKFSSHSDALLEAMAATDGAVRMLKRVRARIAEAEAEQSALEVEIKAAIGDAAGMQGRDWRATWKKAASGGIDYKGVAESLGATPDVLAQFARPGSRRLLVTFPKED